MLTVEQINEESFKDGWGIFYTGIQDAVHNEYELQRLDEAGIFESDVEAIYHVVALADNYTSGLHAQALYWLASNSPNELDGTIQHIIGKDTYSRLLKSLNIKL